MDRIKITKALVFLPNIVLPEVASAISRGTDNVKKALEFVEELKNIPNFVFIPIDEHHANLSSKLAAENGLRGCDAIYVAVAFHSNVKLITLDNNQYKKASEVIQCLTPKEELELESDE